MYDQRGFNYGNDGGVSYADGKAAEKIFNHINGKNSMLAITEYLKAIAPQINATPESNIEAVEQKNDDAELLGINDDLVEA